MGDVVYRDYSGYVVQEGVFGQLEYNLDGLSTYVNGAINNTSYWKRDRFYYDKDHERSKTGNYLGGNIKAGANYNIDVNNNVFLNAGFISRAPKFNGAFMNSTTSNYLNADARNEKIGYKIREAQMQKIPYMLVVGDKEAEDGTVSVRRRGAGDQGSMSVEDFIALCKEDIDSKKIW